MRLDSLPLPPHFAPAHAAVWAYSPDQTRLFDLAEEWRLEHSLKPAGSARFDLHLLVIDAQKDFCLPEGSLFVAGRSGTGAIEDSCRIAEFVYRNLGTIKNITTTMDTHFSHQIFFPSFWLDGDGCHPGAHTLISAEEVRSGRYRPDPDIAWWLCGGDYAWLEAQALHYCEQLERTGKYTLYLWPPHCVVGSDGHALVGVVHEARLFHSYARAAQSWVELKGDNPLTENYSVLRPEVLVRHDGQPLAQKNRGFLEALFAADAVAIAGEASSHCVKSTIDDLLGEILERQPGLVQKVYILSDCMSAVVVPGRDFTPQAEEALQRFANHGMHVVKSTDPIEAWPGIRL